MRINGPGIAWLRHVAITLFTVIVAGGAAHAQSAEQIVLPFECTMAGGTVRATPSSDQAYRILGAREVRPFRACSRQNPDRCRTFEIHRFTMNCGRDRVGWSDFYAAISRATDQRATLEAGRVVYRFGDRQNRYETGGYPYPERPRSGGSGVVEFPVGFAPLAGANAIFTPLDPRVAALENGVEGRFPQVQSEPLKEAPLPERKPAPALSAPPVSAPSETAAIAPPPSPAGEAPVETSSTEKAPIPGTPSEPFAPTILNNPAAGQVRAAAEAHQRVPDTVVGAVEIPADPAADVAPSGGTSVLGWEGTARMPDLSVPPLMIALAIALATFGILLMILKKQAASPMGPVPAARGSVEPVLPGFSEPASRASSGIGQELVVRDAPASPALAGPERVANNGMPATRGEALETLGLSSDANDAVVRKVLEALRQSWHPDMATGEADRIAREERLKRINVAADILLRRPAA